MAVDDTYPVERVFVTVGETKYELVPTHKLTMPELREAKRVSKGMPLVDMEMGIAKSDPDAWFAWLYVSIRRKQPTLTEAALENMIGDTPLVAVIETVEKEALEVAAPDPPAVGASSECDAPENGNGSGETTLPLSTPATSGLPT